MTDLVIIGGGPAGMSAAVAAYESGVRDILMLERDEHLGGILQQCIQRIPHSLIDAGCPQRAADHHNNRLGYGESAEFQSGDLISAR